jgi:UDP-N-acetylglucosamine 2-epimerase (non-hydrolysing)
MREVLDYYAEGAAASTVHAALGLTRGEYVVVSAHREENVDRPDMLRALVDIVNALGARYRMPVVVSTHPRTRDRLARLSRTGGVPDVHPLVRFLSPFGFFDYVALQRGAWCVVSDSGTLTEEASLIGFPAVMIREAHERPEGMDRGVLVSAVLRRDRVLAAVDLVTAQAADDRRLRVVPDYAVDDVSRRVVRIVVSYLDVVNREVWHREPRDVDGHRNADAGPDVRDEVGVGIGPDGADGASPDGADADGASPDGADADGASPDGASPDGAIAVAGAHHCDVGPSVAT